MNSNNVSITFRLSKTERAKLNRRAKKCGLSTAEFIRRLCQGELPQPKPDANFWELLDLLYEVHEILKQHPEAEEVCIKIERLVLKLQEQYTTPQQFNVTEKGA